MNDYSIHASHEFRGSWWVPNDDPELIEKKTGTLRFTSDKGLSLRLHGSFNEDIDSRTVTRIPTLLGEASGHLLTLQHCVETNAEYGFGVDDMEARESTVWASRAFIGTHFESADDIKFERIFAKFQHLSPWMWAKTFDIQRNLKEGTSTVKMITPDPIFVELHDGSKVGIAYSSAGPRWKIAEGELDASVSPNLYYEEPNGLTFEQGLTGIRRFQHFLTMAIGRPCHITEIGGFRGKISDEDQTPAISRLISIIHQPRDNLGDGRPAHPAEMIFSFDNIVDDFEEYISNWYSADENMRVVQNLYFSTRYDTRMLVDNRFMYLVQALESFHLLRFESRVMDDKLYQSRKSELLKDVPNDEFKRLAGQALTFGNTKSLYDRLIELADKYGRVLTGSFGAGREDFIRKVARTRHYRTHFDPKGKKDTLDGAELLQAYRLLRIMMECCFLVELGMDHDSAQTVMSKKADYFV